MTVALIVWLATTGTTGGVAGVVPVAARPRVRVLKGNRTIDVPPDNFKAPSVKTVSMVPACVACTVPAMVNWAGKELLVV